MVQPSSNNHLALKCYEEFFLLNNLIDLKLHLISQFYSYPLQNIQASSKLHEFLLKHTQIKKNKL